MLIFYATLALAFTLLCLLAFISCAYQLSKHGDVKFLASLSVLIFALLAFYAAYGYVSTWLQQQAVDVRLY
ncbi:hypothetical protein SM14VA5_13180 [Serratia marcescens]|uniref:hypothetical protein n=1 Tax=Serratia marcescens TaxID=615 RepID=UPI000B4D49C7|nr:hypothetical protein [Serratia marcescens]ASC78235.1 hypothetical protein CDA58_09845 [Serratia marcescens]NGH09865.1 hypothetical protein [Serratia marcescens]NIA33372.1 hypothetical protein [Serratia marcescens]BEM08814.1 hypothetical protein SM14VA5_13180 [Serratia marcescens]